MLLEKMDKDFVQAMKNKDALRVSVLKMLKSQVKYREIDNPEKPVTDEDVVEIIGKEIKKHEESIEMYRTGNREDLAKKEEEELKILKEYLPRQMTEEEVIAFVSEVVAKLGAEGPKDFGRVMKEIMTALRGKADGAIIKRTVEESLKK